MGGARRAPVRAARGGPLERGYATTLGNALRRVLLSAIPGAAVVRVLFPGRFHEYDTIPGVREDVLHIILNLKGLAIRCRDEALHRLYLNATGPGEVRAGDIETPAGVEIANPDHLIATLEKKGKLEMEMEVEVGRGFRPAEENKREDAPVSLIPVDADFSPIERVNFTVEPTRVGGRSGYERLLLDVWTNGAISPVEALGQAVEVLRTHLELLGGRRGREGRGPDGRGPGGAPPAADGTGVRGPGLQPPPGGGGRDPRGPPGQDPGGDLRHPRVWGEDPGPARGAAPGAGLRSPFGEGGVMRHRRKVPKLSMTSDRRRAVLAGQARDLILYGKVDTTPPGRRRPKPWWSGS